MSLGSLGIRTGSGLNHCFRWKYDFRQSTCERTFNFRFLHDLISVVSHAQRKHTRTCSAPHTRQDTRFRPRFLDPQHPRNVGAAGLLQPARHGPHLYHAGGQSGRIAPDGGRQGSLYAWWAAFQSLLPIVTGGFADRFGYKRTLAGSISMMMAGYLMIAFMRDLFWLSNYWGFF